MAKYCRNTSLTLFFYFYLIMPPAVHTEIYTRRDYIIPRIFNLQTVDAATQDTIRDVYQKYIDDLIDVKLRAKLGFKDINGYTINLPLDATLTKHEINTITPGSEFVKVFLYPAIRDIADDGTIALYRYDQGEATERLERFEERIDSYLDTVFGITINRALDFTKISPGADLVTV